MELLRVLGMPFQLASLLFVAVSALILALVTSVGGATMLLAIFAIWLMLVWLTQFAFALIDDAANGVRETAAASAEMLSPFGDTRCWVHPILVVAIGATLLLQPQIPRLPVLAAVAALFPASIGAVAISGRALDALNPVAMVNVMRGLGFYYVLAVLWLAGCVLLGLLLESSPLWRALRYAGHELLVLLVYAFIGGAVFMRRIELGFQPRVSPEQASLRLQGEREAERQRMIDGLYSDLRVRETARAAASAARWLQQSGAQHLPGDVRAILAAGSRWHELRTYPQLLRSLVTQLLVLRQPALGYAAAEAGLAVSADFSVATESDAIGVIGYALQTGRKRTATALLGNYLATTPGKGEPGPQLRELQQRLLGTAASG